MDNEDRKLLEAAARAAGIEIFGFCYDEDSFHYCDVGPDEVIKWNPLRDDGDALRLAVKLGIEVHDQYQYRLAGATVRVPFREFFEDINGDPYAATRRAIVRAAAAMAQEGGGNGLPS